jgi:hypothetical protein
MESGSKEPDMRRFIIPIATAACLTVVLGCYPPSSRLNAPPQGDTPRRSELQKPFIYMNDNAMLADMSLTDIHFVPHTAELNSLGAHRLDRYAQLLDTYGGTLRYDTELTDDELVAARMQHIKDYLATTNINPERVQVTRDMAGGKGMLAAEAIIVREASMASPDAKSGQSGAQVPGTGYTGRGQ